MHTHNGPTRERDRGGQQKRQESITVAALRNHLQENCVPSTQKSSKPEKSANSTRSESQANTSRGNSAESNSKDALALLKADHKQVAQWFEHFEGARSQNDKQRLAQQRA